MVLRAPIGGSALAQLARRTSERYSLFGTTCTNDQARRFVGSMHRHGVFVEFVDLPEVGVKVHLHAEEIVACARRPALHDAARRDLKLIDRHKRIVPDPARLRTPIGSCAFSRQSSFDRSVADHQARGVQIELRLRPLGPADEAAFQAAQRVMAAEHFPFAFEYNEAMRWPDFLEQLEAKRLGTRVSDGWVPSTFLVADVGGRIIGRTSIRHHLNDFLAHEGGHIGYCVLPSERRRGYATEILRQSLTVAGELGIARSLLCCDDENNVSATTIERCGGVFDSKVHSTEGTLVRRYWIEVKPARD